MLVSLRGEMKSEQLAGAVRGEGNKFYSARKFFEALLKYNESLCHAPKDNESLGLAYANRSAVFFEMKLFEKALNNISLARDHKYPPENLEILEKRREKCLAAMTQQKKIVEPSFFKISHKVNKKLPFAAECLELKVNEKFGKHIVTNQRIKVGDILVIERPFCSVLLSESQFVDVDRTNKFQRCSFCLRDNQLDLIPCDNCCEVMFCSLDCQQKSFKMFHHLECPVMSSLVKSGSVNIALRIFFIALSAFDGSIEKLQDFIALNEKSTSTVFDFDFSSEQPTENLLKCLNSLSRSSKIFSLQAHSDILNNHPQLRETWKRHENFIKDFLQRQCQTNDHYFHGIFSGSLRLMGGSKDQSALLKSLQQSIGSGWFPFCSLINHSCVPNVIRIYTEGKVALVACRPIEKGAQLFDCYKSSLSRLPKADRQAKLLKEFNFICDCEACERNFPPNLNFKNPKLLKFAKKVEEEILSMKKSQALKKFRDCCEAFEANHQTFPCIELSLLQKCMAMFLLNEAKPVCLFP